MNNKVTVNIYGKEFTVSGDKPAEQIMTFIAGHSDGNEYQRGIL